MVSKNYASKTAMWFLLVTDAMTFAGFLIAYAVYRVMHAWPSPKEHLGIALSSFATFILICSSVSMVFSIDACKEKNKEGMLFWLLLTILGGFSFLGIQVYEYTHLIHNGMTFTTFAHGIPLFSTTFFLITGFHGLHVLIGTIYLFILYILAFSFITFSTKNS